MTICRHAAGIQRVCGWRRERHLPLLKACSQPPLTFLLLPATAHHQTETRNTAHEKHDLPCCLWCHPRMRELQCHQKSTLQAARRGLGSEVHEPARNRPPPFIPACPRCPQCSSSPAAMGQRERRQDTFQHGAGDAARYVARGMQVKSVACYAASRGSDALHTVCEACAAFMAS